MASESFQVWLEKYDANVKGDTGDGGLRPGDYTVSQGVATKEHDPWQDQVGGNHYKNRKIQPLEYALANYMGPMEHAVVKYVTRHPYKGTGKEDLEKAIDYLKKMIAHYYD